MSPERSVSHVPRRWSLRATWGELAFAALLVALASGIPLIIPYDVSRAHDSLALLLLTNPAGAWFRTLHYWSAQAFLLLTLAHAWDHLRRGTETRLRRGAWFRVSLTAPLAAFLLLSGFLLKGDAEAQQAGRILAATLEQIPLAGRTLSLFVLGAPDNRQALYLHHAATATILTWLFVAEHARTSWPRAVISIEAFLVAAATSAFVSPALHDGLSPLMKGPWYFLGLQEILHWLSSPVAAVVLGAALFALLVALPRLTARLAHVSKWLLLSALAAYAALTIVGTFFRGEGWAWGFTWEGGTSGLVAHSPWSRWSRPSLDLLQEREIPVVLGRREGCLFCHRGVKGLSASHAPEAVGCASCHGGNPFALDASTAHANMRFVPGNLADAERSCGAAPCHPGIPARVRGSLMNTLAGIVSVDRAVFEKAEGARPPAAPTVAELGRAGADSHLRQLCASCHLGGVRSEWGAIGETSRGGGCNACHLSYSGEALRDMQRYVVERDVGRAANSPTTHPNLSLVSGRQHCFGCHSRSGRISTSYEGLMESEHSSQSTQAGQPRLRSRRLEDGREFHFVQADIHAEKGMECVDCHTSREVMGDGHRYGRKWEAVRVACEDCHFTAPPRSVALDQLDAEALKIARLRQVAQPGARFLQTAADPLLNTSADAAGKWWLATKAKGGRLELRPPASVCVEGGGHARLSCISCHSPWAPRCTRCHTRFDPGREGIDLLDGGRTKGDWIETGGGFSAVPPTLGIRSSDTGVESGLTGAAGVRQQSRRGDTVDPFVPGMILTIDRNQAAGGKPDHVFRRLYARAFSHTISKGGRSCTSCHNDPVALGYGEGRLEYVAVSSDPKVRAHGGSSAFAKPTADPPRATRGGSDPPYGRTVRVWRFTPKQPPGPDGLPADAWIGFLQERRVGASTRRDVRPFSIDEQKRILTVGACLTCHEETSAEMRTAVRDWKGTLARVSRRCVLPRW